VEPMIVDLARDLVGQWLALLFVALWAIDRSGIVNRWFGSPLKERAQLSADTQGFIQDLREELDGTRRRALEDRRECEAEIAKLGARIDTLLQGEKRWRHLAGHIAQYVAILRDILEDNRIAAPQFQGWKRFIEEGGTPEEYQPFTIGRVFDGP